MFVCSSGVQLYLKWAKNLQRTDQSHVLLLPRMENEFLCPVVTINRLFSCQSYKPTDPVLKWGDMVFTETHLRRRLALVLKMLNSPVGALTYHALRRSGASLAFNNKCSMEGIRSHGTWASDAVWSYLFANSHRVKEIPNVFREVEKSIKCLRQM